MASSIPRGVFTRLACAALITSCSAQLTLTINTTVPFHKMSGSFLNFNIDTGSIFNGLDFADPALINLVYALTANTGTTVRVGGTAADYSYFIPDAPSPQGPPAATGSVTYLSSALLESLWVFGATTHANILFDFNGLSFRTPAVSGPWSPSGNATAILEYYNTAHGGAMSNWAWSLGNEPEFWTGPVKANYTQLAYDGALLSSTLRGYKVGSSVAGPSFGTLALPPITEYLTAVKKAGGVDALTVHNYPLARDCTIPAYLNKTVITGLWKQLTAISELKASLGVRIDLVLEEVAGSYGGGCENITDRFASGFSWIAILGAVGTSGFDRLHRQDIVGWSFTGGQSHYQLAGPPGWTNGTASLRPHPDWYTSVLFKQLVGSASLSSTVTGDAGLQAGVTLTSWCSGAPWWDNEALVVSFANPTGVDVTLDVVTSLPAAPRNEFFLTSSTSSYTEWQRRVAQGQLHTVHRPADPPSTLDVDAAFLNGVELTVDAMGLLPVSPIPGRAVTDPTAPLVIPPYSYGFIQYPGAGLKAC